MSDLVRISITIPRGLAEDLKTNVKNLSKYITKAIIDRRHEEKRERAWNELLKAPPTFKDIDDPVAYIDELRSRDIDRMKRLGLHEK